MRQSNEQLEKRLARIEDQQAVVSAKRSGRVEPPAAQKEQPWSGGGVPELTVVKLKPKREAAPPLETDTDVQEPSTEHLQAMLERAERQQAAEEPEDEVPAVDPAMGDQLYDQAVAMLKTGNISGAVLKLQAFAEEYPRHAQSDNALYFSGVGLMTLDDFDGAARAFERVLAEYPAGDARIESMLKLADCRLKQNQKDDARALYAKLISHYPGTAAANTAQQRLAHLKQ